MMELAGITIICVGRFVNERAVMSPSTHAPDEAERCEQVESRVIYVVAEGITLRGATVGISWVTRQRDVTE